MRPPEGPAGVPGPQGVGHPNTKTAPYVRKAVSAVKSYESFVGLHAHLVVGGAYPPSEELVGWFVLWRLDCTRALKMRTGKPFKGSSGKDAVKGLGYAHTLWAAPFGASVLGGEVVSLAVKKPPDAVDHETEVAHAGLFVQG